MKPIVALLILGCIIVGILILRRVLTMRRVRKHDKFLNTPDGCILDNNGTYGTLAECEKVNRKFDPNWPHIGDWYFASGDDHRTSSYRFKENIRFVVRRGFDFVIMTRSGKNLDKVDVKVNPGPNKVKIARVVTAGNFLVFRTDQNSPVGSAVITIDGVDLPFFVIFNSYNKEDPVYMDSKDAAEYVLNEQGYVFQGGSTENCSGRVWRYAQFNEEVIVSTIGLLEEMYGKYEEITGKKYTPEVDMSSPVDVVRYLTSAGNAIVLTGNWSKTLEKDVKERRKKGDKYVKAPWEWTGSDDIFTQYLTRKNDKGVEYPVVDFGQCWVFGGILNSMCRSIGVPARHISNFSSAHPNCPTIPGLGKSGVSVCDYSQANFTNVMFDEQEKPSGSYFNGMVWNFHSWNDAWMNRPDLPAPYSGWQAVDATLQERSAGIGRMGPAPLFAVKNMNPMVNYDASFVISEVNWIVELNDKTGTKIPGGGTPVTSIPLLAEYKPVRPNSITTGDEDWDYYKEMSTVSKVLQPLASEYKPSKPLAAIRPLDLTHPGIKSSIPAVGVADRVPISVQIFPKMDEKVTVQIDGILTMYTGEPMSDSIYFDRKTVDCQAGKPQVVVFYMDASTVDISDANYLKFNMTAVIGGVEYTDVNTTYLKPPLVGLKQVNSGSVSVTYTNPYKNRPLTGVQIELTGNEVIRDVIIIGVLEPGKTYTTTRTVKTNVKPHYDMDFISLSATLTCNEFSAASSGYLSKFTIK